MLRSRFIYRNTGWTQDGKKSDHKQWVLWWATYSTRSLKSNSLVWHIIRLIGYFISLNIFVFVPPDCCYARYSASLLQCLRESIQMERRYFTAKWLRPTITITPRHGRCSSGNFRGFPSSNCNSFPALQPLYWLADTAPAPTQSRWAEHQDVAAGPAA